MALPTSLCFIDTETTGTNAAFGRIIEIGIIKVVDGKVVKEFKTLLNPQTFLDPFIENMTGITSAQLENAPEFYSIKDELLEIFSDSIFVAHNVRFDYGFIRNEFKRIGIKFTSRHFDTIKLAKLLYPNYKHYNLDAIIENFGIKCENRHRAYDDAKVIYEFYEQSRKNIKPELFEQAVGIALKRTSVPISIPIETIDNLPEAPGVYLFYDEFGAPLYIGKSINIRDRVLSHFSNDHLSLTDMKLSKQAAQIETIETAGELGALLLESTLIKEKQPIFNRMLRESRKMPILLKTENKKGYFTVDIKELNEIESTQIENVLGVFRTLKQTKEYLYTVAKEYKLCPKILGIEKGRGACFYSYLNLCMGACNNLEATLKYNLRFEEGFYKRKVRPWRFDSPILIKEEGDMAESHLIDKWCYLGSLKSENDNIEDLQREYRFDYDTYKILSRFIMDPKNEKKIKVLN